jgi:T5SS/PEP-CTERM-associated repeat protein
MSASTWTWKGVTGLSTTAADWTLTSGSGNAGGIPQPGDVVIVPSGTIQDGLTELSGQGGVTIQAGATVAVSAATDGISLGQTAATSGTMTVTGSAALLSVASGTNGVVIGNAGTGDLFVQNGGSVNAGTQASGAINIGVSATGTGAVTASGLGSSIAAHGQIDVGVAGNGSLTVQNQATVSSGGATSAPSQGIDIAQSSGGSGVISVTGTNSLLSNTGAFIVGDAGSGSLSIASGGTVITTPGSVAGLAGLVIGDTASAVSAGVTLTGAGSQLDVTGLLEVGAAGFGALQLSDGASVTAGSLDAGAASTGGAQIDLTGTGTSLTLLGTATVGDGSNNVALSVLGGATFAATGLTVGTQLNSFGAITVSGQGSVIDLSGELNLGTPQGQGELTVGEGATVEAAVVNLANGQVQLEGGLIDPTVIKLVGTSVGGDGTIDANYIIDEGTIVSSGSQPNATKLVVQGTVVGGGTLTISGSAAVVGTTAYSPGLLQINTGDTLELTGAVLNAAATTFTDTQGGTYAVNNSAIDVVFGGTTGVLALDDIAGFAGTIATYHAGDAFVITGGTLSSLGVSNGNTLTVHDSGTGAGAGGIDQIIFASAINPASLTIENGNTITGAPAIANGSTLEIATGPYALTAFDASGTPRYTTLQIDSGISVTTDATDLFAGVTLNNQGTLNLGAFSLSGSTVVGTGSVTVDATGGTAASATVAGGGVWSGTSGFVVGATGAGNLFVNTAGSVSVASLDVARSAGSSGDITVSGTKSLLSDTGAFIVGDAGLGQLSIGSGGTVTASTGATIGNTGSASGSSVNVSGAGSNWQIAGALTVGGAGYGALSISQAGSVGAVSLNLGGAAGGSAVISVVGANSVLNVASLVTIGGLGPATVSVLNDGTLSANDVNIGTDNSTGVLVIDGSPAGGIVTQGNVPVADGGVPLNAPLEVADNLTVGTDGVFSIGAGVVVHIENNYVVNGSVSQGAGSIIDPNGTTTNNSPTGSGSGATVVGSGGFVNNSTYFAGGTFNGQYILNGPSMTGTGVLEVEALSNPGSGAPGDLVLNIGSVAATQTVVFSGGPGTLTVGSFVNGKVSPATTTYAIGGFGAVISTINSNDTIVVDTTAAAVFAVNAGNAAQVLVTDVVGGKVEGTLTFASSALAATVVAGTGGVLVDQSLPCFAAGTMIETVTGPRPVEALVVGDAVRTFLGSPKRIVWVGSRRVDCARHPRPETLWPVRIARGAFGENVPSRDLFVSPDHAIYVDGVLVPAKLLVNGGSITQVKRDRVTYHHVELPEHAVIQAEGLTVESYLDTGDRAKFSGGPVTALYPEFTARMWEATGCAPLVLTGPELVAVRDRVNARAAGLALREDVPASRKIA